MHEMILCKLGEVVLKGLNRRSFEDKLMANVNRRVAKCGNFRIYAKQSTIYVEPKDENCDIEAAFEGCKKVFGIIAVSKALPCEKDVQKIIGAAKEYLADEMRAAKSFKVESKRADKTFPLTSIQLSQQVGGALHQAFPTCEVNVHDPELVVHIEIRDDSAYVHGPAEEGAGGLPIGMGGVAKSKQLAEIAKLKTSNMGEEDTIKKAYLELGRLYYAERGAAPEGAYAAACGRISQAKAAIETNNARIAELTTPIGRIQGNCRCQSCIIYQFERSVYSCYGIYLYL